MTKKVQIRGTNLIVNPIGLGTNAVGGQKYYPEITDDAGREFLRTALDIGVDFWDTAFTYGPKRSEEIIGEVLKETGARNKVVLATKAAHKITDAGVVFDNSPAFLEQAVYDALKRLQTDYIDLFYIHYPDEQTPKYEAVGALQRLKEKGMIRAIGVSNFSPAQLAEANRDGYVNVVQGEYNLLARAAEDEFFPYVRANNMSFVPYFPFASGLLAGRYTKETTFSKGDLRLKNRHFKKDVFTKNLNKVEQLRELAGVKKANITHLVLARYLAQDVINVVIPGAKRGEQVKDNVRALDVTLTEAEKQAIDKIFSPKGAR